MKEAIAILTGGGPAPGMNTVVGSVAKTFLRQGYRVIGLHEGYTGLFNPSPRTVDIDYPMADGIFNQGGSFLQMSRFKPKDSDFENNFNLKFFTDNNIKLLVTVGGDDTASTANRIAKFLEAKKYPIANIHVPKTIDNDLPLPKGTPTFGYESAKDKGAVIARAVYVDARTSGNWFVLAAMGRSAGHLAFGIGEACHYPMIVIPEMFDKTEITVEKIVNLVISSIIKRKIMGMDYGAAVISEGVFHALSDEEIRKSGIHFTYDEHGHPELGKVSKAHIFNEMIEKKFKELGLKVKSRPVELGYEIRCQTPIAYDLTYCSELGIGVHKLFAEGKTGCMVYVDSEGNVSPLYLKDLQDPTTGKIPPRLVDIKSDKFSSVVETILNAITPADYEAAKQYVSKIYGLDTNRARTAVDVTTYEDSEDDEYNIVLKKKGWKYEYSVDVKINSGEINQSAISEEDKWISASDASYRKGIERKYLRTVQQMMDKIAPNQPIKSIYGISRFDTQNLLLYGEITYYVRSEDGVTYVIKYAPSDKCLTGVFVHKDFHELWQQMKREKKQDQKEGINTIIEKCY